RRREEDAVAAREAADRERQRAEGVSEALRGANRDLGRLNRQLDAARADAAAARDRAARERDRAEQATAEGSRLIGQMLLHSQSLRDGTALLTAVGNPVEALGSLRGALGIYQSLIARQPGNLPLQADRARVYAAIGRVLAANRRPQEALQHLEYADAL